MKFVYYNDDLDLLAVFVQIKKHWFKDIYGKNMPSPLSPCVRGYVRIGRF